MVDQSLTSYIKQNLRDGFSETEIRQALLGVGWGAMDIEEAFIGTSEKPRPQSMDILEKELLPQDSQKKPGIMSKMRRMVIPSVVIIVGLPLLGIGGLWTYQRYNQPEISPAVRSAVTEQTEPPSETTLHDRQTLEQIQNLQTDLANFYETNHAYPQTLDTDYLYQTFGEPPFDYSLSFMLITDYGTLSAGLHTVNPSNVINASLLGNQEQYLTGVFGKSPTPELRLSDLANYYRGDEITINVDSTTDINQAVLVIGSLRLIDSRAPYVFTFSGPLTAGTYPVRVFGFAKDGSILFQTANLTVNP